MQIKDYSQTTPNTKIHQSPHFTLETITAALLFILPALLLFIFAAN